MSERKRKGVDFYEGQECRKCGAPLQVLEVNETRKIKLPDGRPLNSSSYECTGPLKHRWATRIDLRPELGKATHTLVPMRGKEKE
jgi:hypothetical protein